MVVAVQSLQLFTIKMMVSTQMATLAANSPVHLRVRNSHTHVKVVGCSSINAYICFRIVVYWFIIIGADDSGDDTRSCRSRK